jgi:uncharacterized protein (TIGR03435 family)
MPGPLNGNRKSLILAVVLIALTSPAAFAQTAPPAASAPPTDATAAKAPAFDVISIRPNKDNAQMSGDGTIRMRVGSRNLPDGYSASNIALKMLLANAYGVKPDQITGGPGWIDSDHFDIEAKVVAANGATPQPLTREQSNLMLRSLLADRFKLVVHNETKEAPIYELVIAKNGSKLQESKPEESTGRNSVIFGSGRFTGHAMQLGSLISILSNQLHRPIVDKTGLTGRYDINLHWTPDQVPGSVDATSTDASGPSIFTAVQEQLGLKLQPAKAPVDVIVIDHIEQPTAN